MRLVVPNLFLLSICGLDDAHRAGLTERLFAALREMHGEREASGTRTVGTHARTPAAGPTTHVPQQPGVPAALRWSSSPWLGFPRAPFLVWRRGRDYKIDVALGRGPFAVSGARTVLWGAGEMIEVLFNASPGGTGLIVEAVDGRSEPIPDQRLVFTSPGSGVFRSPGIAGVRLSGTGSVRDLMGVDQQALANQPDWQLLQRVGFPFDSGEISSPAYTSAPQGFEPASREGLEAAKERLMIAQLLHLDPPATGIAAVPAPAWPASDPGLYLSVLRDQSPGPLRLIQECLENTDDSDPSRLQADFHVDVTVDGIRQAGAPGATPGDPATAALPVVGVTMLSVASDSDAATGLGYGTIDVPPARDTRNPYGDALLPPGVFIPAFDYMVTAEYVLPFFGTLELAALGQALPPPDAATALQAAATTGNRPPTLDQPASQVVSLSWALPRRQQGYGLAVSRAGAAADVLNAERPFGAGGFDPFIPLRPPNVNGAPPPGVRVTYVDPAAPTPLSGSIASRYLIVGRDVAGRWSNWTSVVHTATAPPVEAPGLLSAAFELGTLPTDGSKVAPAVMVIEFSWDWADRTPRKIEFFGTFFVPTATPSGTFTGGFAKAASGPIEPPVEVTFDAAGNPILGAAHTGTVAALAATAPASTTPGDTRRYRLRVQGLSCNFASAGELTYSVTARGYEMVRPATPPQPSAVVGPRVARADDPFPAPAPTMPIDLIWTALPDAADRARAVLTWPATAGASGYVVWEATETALRTAVDPTAPTPAPGTTMLARAGALRGLVTQNATNRALSLKAFSRMYERPLTATSLELDLPGAADTLYAYRISSLTPSNVESERSATVALVAVRRRSEPGRPRLLVRRSASPLGVDVIVLPGPGPSPAGYRVHRVRRASLATDVGLMGPPKYGPADPGWAPVSVPASDGSVEAGSAILDPVSPGWHAYHYRCVAIGQSDPANGVLAGESAVSAAASIVLPPAAGPLLDAVSQLGPNSDNRVLTFRTDLPAAQSPLGRATIAVSAIATVNGGVKRHTLLSVDSAEVSEGPPLALLPAGSAELTGMPHVARGAADADGRAVYTVRLPAVLPDGASGGAISVTDPVGRTVEVPWP
jgi:hypothetical protein